MSAPNPIALKATIGATLTLLAMVLSVQEIGAAEWKTLPINAIEAPTGSPSIAPRLTGTFNTEDSADHAILTWLEKLPDSEGNGHRFRFARFDGARFGPARTIARDERFFVNWADTPGMAMAAPDFWVAHWLQRSGQGTYAYDIKAAISRDAGMSWSEPISPHRDGTLTEHGFVSYFSTGPENIGFSWLDGRLTTPSEADSHNSNHHGVGGGPMTLRTAQLSPDGRLYNEAVLDNRVCDCCATATAQTSEGAVVVYRDRSDDEIRDIRLVRQTASGWSDPISVHNDGWRIAGCPVNGPAVLAFGQTVVVAWFTLHQDAPVVRVALSEDGGRIFSAPTDIDHGSAVGRVDLAATSKGFVLSWMARDTSGGQVRLAHFNSGGAMTGRWTLFSLNDGRSSGFPRLKSLGEQRLLVAWTGEDDLTGEAKVFAGEVDIP